MLHVKWLVQRKAQEEALQQSLAEVEALRVQTPPSLCKKDRTFSDSSTQDSMASEKLVNSKEQQQAMEKHISGPGEEVELCLESLETLQSSGATAHSPVEHEGCDASCERCFAFEQPNAPREVAGAKLLRKAQEEALQQSLAEVEALRVGSDMPETDLKTCKAPPMESSCDALADMDNAQPLVLVKELAPADGREALEVVDKDCPICAGSLLLFFGCRNVSVRTQKNLWFGSAPTLVIRGVPKKPLPIVLLAASFQQWQLAERWQLAMLHFMACTHVRRSLEKTYISCSLLIYQIPSISWIGNFDPYPAGPIVCALVLLTIMAPEVLPGSRRDEFQDRGFLLLKGFVSKDECENMKQRMKELVDGWDPQLETPAAFTTDSKQQTEMQGKSDYFLDSADRIHFFIEKSAADKDGKLKAGQKKFEALNKVGHGLHVLDPVFRDYSQSSKISELVEELGWKDPVLPQSMYIFKQPLVGGEVTSHQDSSFLYTTPRPTCLGLWLALDKATTENGCLWARPASHKEPVRRVFVRNPEHFDNDNKNAPQLVFEALDEGKDPAWQWEGKMPEGHEPPSQGLMDSGFCPLECEAGDLVVIHGQVDHLSLANTSNKPRETFQLHLVEGPAEGITWSPRNWLQYPLDKKFPSLSKKRKAWPDVQVAISV
eukprot:s4492_g3.t2